MADTGATYPGTASTQAVSPEDDIDWQFPDRIKADDGNYARLYHYGTGSGYSYRLKATNFGFSLPTGATIDGIKVEIERKESVEDFNVYDYRVQLLDADGNLIGDNKKDASEWTTYWFIRTYGGATDKWNASPTKAMVENANFGVVLSASYNNTSGYGRDAQVDFIRITIYYTPVTVHEVEVSDGIALTDTLVKTPMLFKSDGLALSDALVKNPIKTLVDGIAFTDIAVVYRTAIKVVTDGIAFTDIAVVYRTAIKVVTDGIAFKDVLVKTISKTLTDGIAFKDVVSYVKNPTKLAELIRKLLQMEDIGGGKED